MIEATYRRSTYGKVEERQHMDRCRWFETRRLILGQESAFRRPRTCCNRSVCIADQFCSVEFIV